MADVEIKYKGTSIATLDASGTKTLKTVWKYCEDDITVSYTKSAVPAETNRRSYEYDNPAAVSGSGNYITVVSGDDTLKRVRSLDTLLVVVNLQENDANNHVKSCLGCNVAGKYGFPGDVAIAYQTALRAAADGSLSTAPLVYAVDSEEHLRVGPGRIHITPEGDLRIYVNSDAYPILAGKVIVEVIW